MVDPLPGDAERMDAPPGGAGDLLRPPAGLVSGGPFRYARWDGRQRLPELDAGQLLDALGDDLLADGDVGSALGRLYARGLRRAADGSHQGMVGLRDLGARLARAREQSLSRYHLAGVMEGLRQALDEILAAERRGLERRLGAPAEDEIGRLASQLAARRRDQLDDLPAELGGRLRGLQEYDFMEPEARRLFGELLDRIRQRVVESYFSGLAEAIRGTSPEALAANREMVRDLNRLLQDRLAGGNPDASDFLARHGPLFPGARTLDDVIEQLAGRMAAMQSLLSSLGPDQRRELQEMMDSLLRDDRLRWDLAQLAATLDQLMPDGLGRSYDFTGSEALDLDGALGELARLDQLESMSAQVGDARSPAALEAIDPGAVEELLDEQAADDLRALQALSRRLEESGLVERQGDHLRLTPRGTRRIGQRVLDELFRRLRRDVFGGHQREDGGLGREAEQTSRQYEFGRPFLVDLPGTLANALAREGPMVDPGGAPFRLHLQPEDFMVHETSASSRAATVLLVDMSRSMLLRGCFLAAKKVAIALDALIRARYPHDELHVVGFAYYARPIRPGALAGLSWHGYEYGTNLQHGLMLARGLLARSHAANRQVIVVTDGEPTAHFEDGEVEFSYPPTRRTINETLREVARCTRQGITINTFMLERSRGLTDFVDRLTRLNRGRAFYASPEQLGEYVLVDYLNRRSGP